jgi:hypothetical protein
MKERCGKKKRIENPKITWKTNCEKQIENIRTDFKRG